MRISELIAALEAIRREHGDLPVVHENDWSDFLVTTIEYVPELSPSDPLSGYEYAIPAHVRLDDCMEHTSGEYPSGFAPKPDETAQTQD